MTDNVVFGKCGIDSRVFSMNSLNKLLWVFQPRVMSAAPVCFLRGKTKGTNR